MPIPRSQERLPDEVSDDGKSSDVNAAPRSRIGLLWLCIPLGAILVVISISLVRSSTGEAPFLSANDRSRWASMAALVHEQTAIIDRPQAFRDPKTNRTTLQTIDRVMHFGPDGQLHSYSSKPPLLGWLYSAVYTVVHVVTGTSVYRSPMIAGRATLLLAHVGPLIVYWCLLLRLFQQRAETGWGLAILMLTAVFGTFVTPFAVTVNNHLPGAIAALIGLWAVYRSVESGSSTRWEWIAGTVAGLGVACELPALAWAAATGLLLLYLKGPRTIVTFGVPLGLIGIIMLAANYGTHGSWRPPYAHRGLGEHRINLPNATTAEDALILPPLVVANATDAISPDAANASNDSKPSRSAVTAFVESNGHASRPMTVVPSLRSPHWEIRITDPSLDPDAKNPPIVGRYALLRRATGEWAIHDWDDWYDHPGTYWTSSKLSGVDRGEPSRMRYTLHVLVGHHGILSLTPIFALSLVGVCLGMRSRFDLPIHRLVTWAIVGVTVVCLVFYIGQPQINRNYGGVSCCFRWLVWCIPLWLWLAIPAADRFSRSHFGRLVLCLLLAVSLFSACSALGNPWRHPWIYRTLMNMDKQDGQDK